MSHNLEQNSNGQAAFVSAREDAWHKLGTVLPEEFTAEQAMEYGYLGGWNVRKVPLLAQAEGDLQLPVENKFAIVRDNPFQDGQVDVLDVMGGKYTVIQNEEHAELLNALVDESGAHFETAGSIEGGRRVFITMKLPGHIRVGGVDQVDNYIVAVNSHDGSAAFTIMVTPIRVVCQNTLNVAFGHNSHIHRVRHTQGAHALLLGQARKALDMSFTFLEGFQEQAEQLINTTVTQGQFEQIIWDTWGAGEDADPGTITRAENRLGEISKLFAESNTQQGVRETAWAGFSALTEYADHFSLVRGSEVPERARSRRAVLKPSFKEQALRTMMARV